MKCEILFSNYGHGPKDKNGCRLERGHTEPHEFIANDGDTYRWHTDWECDCDDSCDGDWCSVYWKHDAAIAAPTPPDTAKEGGN